MRGLERLGLDPWRIAVVAVSGLLIANIVAGLVGLGFNQSVSDAVETSLGYDVELEDAGYDLTAAAFHLRETHRALDIESPTPERVNGFDEAYQALREAIDHLDVVGIRDRGIAQPDQLRALATAYYETFRPALQLYGTDPLQYERISDRSLAVLDQLDRAIQPIDKLGEQHFRAGLSDVARQASSARFVLLWVVGGLALVGLILAFAAVRMLSELRRLYASERAAAQARADFLADIAHELRTPLTVLRTNADVSLSLHHDAPDAPIFREMVSETERMARMLRDLLLLASSDSTALPLDPEPVDVATFLEDLAVRAQTLVNESGATLETHFVADGQLWIDRARIEQVVMILVDNAVKYSPPGRCVMLNASTGSEELCLEVADRGFGIPEEDLPYVFDRFYRADRLTRRVRKIDGAGLGLSIAKTIVEAHDGRISAASRPGGGTRVSVSLPLVTSMRVSSP